MKFLKPTSELWLRMSHNIDNLLCISPYNIRIDKGEISFHPLTINHTRFLIFRIILLEFIFVAPITPKIPEWIGQKTIIRYVYTFCTFSLHMFILLNYFLTVKNNTCTLKTLNNIVKVWKTLENNTTFYQTLLLKRIYFYELLFMFIMLIIFLQQDYLREIAWQDTLAFTCSEILVLKIIFQKMQILLYIFYLFKTLNYKSKNGEIQFIDKAMILYHKINQITKQTNQYNGLFFLIITVNSFTWLIYNSYKFVVISLYQDFNLRTLVSFYLCFTWTGIQVFHLGTIVVTCQKVVDASNNFKFAINGNFNNLCVFQKINISKKVIISL